MLIWEQLFPSHDCGALRNDYSSTVWHCVHLMTLQWTAQIVVQMPKRSECEHPYTETHYELVSLSGHQHWPSITPADTTHTELDANRGAILSSPQPTAACFEFIIPYTCLHSLSMISNHKGFNLLKSFDRCWNLFSTPKATAFIFAILMSPANTSRQQSLHNKQVASVYMHGGTHYGADDHGYTRVATATATMVQQQHKQ